MDDLIAAAVAQDFLDVARAAAGDLRSLVRGIRREAARDLTVGRQDADGVAAAERAVDDGHARGQ